MRRWNLPGLAQALIITAGMLTRVTSGHAEDVIGTFFGRHAPVTAAVATECKALSRSLHMLGAADGDGEDAAPAAQQTLRGALASNVVPFPSAAHSGHAAPPLGVADAEAYSFSSRAGRGCQVAALPHASASPTFMVPGGEAWEPTLLQTSALHSNWRLGTSALAAGKYEWRTHAAAASLASSGVGATVSAVAGQALDRQSIDSQGSCTMSASLSQSSSCSSLDTDERPPGQIEIRSMLRAILMKASSIAALPAALSAYVSIGQQRGLRLPPEGKQNLSGPGSDTAGEREQHLSGSIFWMHR